MKRSYNKGEDNPGYKGKNASNWLGKTNVCLTCGKEYTPKEFREERPPKYCSIKCSKIGKNNPQWKDNVGYAALHNWCYRQLEKPTNCPKCGKKANLDLANISGEYKRNLTDWEWLCRKCHMEKDGITKRLMEYGINSRKYGNINCKNCGKEFLQYFKNQSFCGQSCGAIYTNKHKRIYSKGRKGGKSVLKFMDKNNPFGDKE